MRKIFLIWILVLTIVLFVAGCSKQQPYTGYAPYNPQGGAPPQVPVAGGCGVIAPQEPTDTLVNEPFKSALF